jgi:hypothetical protein
MADVRALLQSERAKRRITHPHATYTSDGKLQCNLCETVVKSEAQWQSHLHSTQHNLQSQRAEDARESRGAGGASAGKKRKAETLDSQRVVERKRARDDDEDDAEVEVVQTERRVKENGRPKKMVKFEEPLPTSPLATADPPALEAQEPDIDESELQALEADLAALEESNSAPAVSALNAEATISAPAMTAEELAAHAREEQSSQKGKRDREIEDEREEAERALEEEFAEMEGFEGRVKKLRERREALRVVSPEAEGGTGEQEADGAEEEDESDEDFDDGWGFGGS